MATKADKLRQAVADAPLTKGASVEEFLEHFFDIAGGPRAVAKLLYQEFLQAKPGSVIRARVLEAVLRSLKFANENTRNPDDLGILSHEDIDRLIAERTAKLAGDADAPPAGHPAPAG